MSFTGNYRDIHSQLFVTNQPQANLNLGSLDFKQPIPIHEKGFEATLEDSHHHHCEHGQTSSFSEHHSCHNIRLRRVLLPAIFALVALGGMLAWSFVNWHRLPAWKIHLMGRALAKRSASTWFNDDVTHVLIIIAVGGGLILIFVTLLLSTYMCPDSFQNPNHCPCYLCGRCYGDVCIRNCLRCIFHCRIRNPPPRTELHLRPPVFPSYQLQGRMKP